MRGFVALDFETATLDRSSACAVGGVVIDYAPGGEWEVSSSFYHLIRPPELDLETGLPLFDGFNIAIHGITPKMVADSPTFDHVWAEISGHFKDRLLLAHNTRFDMYVVRDACSWYGISPGDHSFACSYRLAQATWRDLITYRLDALAEKFDIALDHHNALSDAECCAQIARLAVDEARLLTIEDTAEKLGFRLGLLSGADYRPFSNAKSGEIPSGSRRRLSEIQAMGEASPDHPLFGKSLCFTGTLVSMTREAAAQLAVNVGASAAGNVSKKTDYLVVGVTDLRMVKDGSSSKMRKAVELREGGHPIEIIDEEDFLRLLT